jgi:SAM-dependent methyltransferase
MELEWVPCEICEGTDTETVFTYRFRDGEFQVVRCGRCGLVYLNPRPRLADWRDFYPSPNLDDASTPGLRIDPGIRPRVGFRSRYLRLFRDSDRDAREKSVLDFVCRDGSFLQTLRDDFGYRRLYGIEVRDGLAEKARRAGFEVRFGSIEQAKFPDKHFDIIIMRHTLEHLYHPVAALTEARRILKDDGLLRIELPNIASLSRLISGRHWAGFYIPWHLYYFSPGTLSGLLRRTGFRVIEARTFPYPHFMLSSLFALLNRVVPRKSKKSIAGVFKPGNSVAVGAVLAPLNFISVLIGRGDEIMLACKKSGGPD